MKKYEFINNGSGLKITTPRTPRNWNNYLFNCEYYTEVSQSLHGTSMCLNPIEREFTRGYRYFFIKDVTNNCIFTANYSNYCTDFDKYECIHEINYTELISVKNGIESKIKVFVPTKGSCELWAWEIKCDDEREIELYTCIGSEINGMGITCEYSDNMFTSLLFPYHIKYDEYELVKNRKCTSFCISENKADWYNGSELDFWGSEDKINIPQFIECPVKASRNAYGETPPVFALGYKRTLKANACEKIRFIVGVGNNREEISEYKKYFSKYDKEFENVINQYNEQANRIVIETPDKTFNYMINHWIKKQTICMSTTHRKSIYSCTRNELQDCIGFSLFNTAFSRDEIKKVFKQQYENGSVQQHHVRDDILPPMGLGILNHMDGAVWLIMCTCIVMKQWGSSSLLEEEIGFKQSENSATVYEHLMRAVRFMINNKGQHNMCLIGDGDWTDPINGAGRKGKGECGMNAWGYDENGWPSGFGNGLVTALGLDYQQKFLRIEKKPEHTETAICKSGNHWFYYDLNPFYVDTLDEKVVKAFIDKIYQPYYERYKDSLIGFFTDEPHVSRKGIPWSFVFESEYEKRYGENILLHLEELFLEIDDYKNTRFKFWKMVTELFSSAYMKQIYDWCSKRNLKFTGHLLLEEDLYVQLDTNGACMPHYEYFHIPGMDWLGREVFNCLTARQVGSVAAQLGKEAVLSETFALCGHNVSFDELKGIYEWQMVRGINLLCQHLQGYSIRGVRKRDYPPAMYYQQPWWNGYDKFIDAMSRIGMILKESREKTDTLVIHPRENGELKEGKPKTNEGERYIILPKATLDIYLHSTEEMKQQAADKINARFSKNTEITNETTSKEQERPPQTKFEPKKGKVRKPGTGCISKINEHLYEGRYSPKGVNGKRIARNIYAPTKEECEEKLAVLIKEMKAEISKQKEELKKAQ